MAETVEQQQTEALALADTPGRHIRISDRGLAFESAAEVFKIAQAMVMGGVAPKGMTPGGAMAAMLKGRALGVDEITSVTSITVVNGRTQMQGSLLLALFRRAGIEYDIWYTGEKETREAHIKAWWPGRKERAKERSFAYSDALRAGLVSKENYKAWPDDMYLWRAVAKLARQEFPEIGAGIYVHGEIPGDPEPTTEGADEVTPGSTAPLAPDPLLAVIKKSKVLEPKDAVIVERGPTDKPEAEAGAGDPAAVPGESGAGVAPSPGSGQLSCDHAPVRDYVAKHQTRVGKVLVCESCALSVKLYSDGALVAIEEPPQ